MTELDRQEMLIALERLEEERDNLMREIQAYQADLYCAEAHATDWEQKWYETNEALTILRDYLEEMRKGWAGERCAEFGCSTVNGRCTKCSRDACA